MATIVEPLIATFGECLRHASEIFRSFSLSADTYDSFCSRGRIYHRDTYHHGREKSLLLDCLLDLVEYESSHRNGLDLKRIEAWLVSRAPVLTRVGLYALHLNKSVTASAKVRLLLERGLIHPAVHGATHEAWQVLVSCYLHLSADERTAIWRAVNDGPLATRPDDVKPEQWEEFRQWEINKLSWFIATKFKECPAAQSALEDLKLRAPDFKGHVGMDQVVFGETTVTEGLPTPKTVNELLAAPPHRDLDWLLGYKDDEGPRGATREGLLHAIGAATAQNRDWGITLLKALGSRNEWKTDLWDAVFWRMSLAKLPSEDLAWLLRSLEEHFAETPHLRSISFFLFHSVQFSEERQPSPENISLMLRLSLLIWHQLKREGQRVREGYNEKEWTTLSVNHPAGHITEFWLKYLDYERRTKGDGTNFPDWLKAPLADFVAGAEYASQLGRVTLAHHLQFVYHVDPSWTATNLFPRFEFSTLGDEAFLMWEPHAGYGNLSRDLIMVMPAIYRAAFRHFQNVDARLQSGFFRHVAAIVYSCLIDVNQDNWLAEFLVGLTDEQRANWALQFGRGIEHAPETRRSQIWQTWMKPYWRDRLAGRPCALSHKEAQEMMQWAFDVGSAFPEAVDLVIQGPRLGEQFGTVEYLIKQHASVERFPEAVLRLLNWILDQEERQFVGKDIEALVFRLPKRRTFLPQLDKLCQNLARLGYPGATELKARIIKEFTLV
jgi:hypothetical protein